MAARQAGIVYSGHELIRDGSNVMFRLSCSIVARIGRPGTAEIAKREVRVSRWLRQAGVRVVEVVDDVPQGIIIQDRPITWWRELPPHRWATPAELGSVLHEIHRLNAPDVLHLPNFDPFSGLDRKLHIVPGLDSESVSWLGERLRNLRLAYSELTTSSELVVIHGDAWQGNVVVPECGEPTVIDLEAFSVGNREWDLVQIAVDYADFARLTTEDYREFVRSYGGYDMTKSPNFRIFADIQELRWVCFALSKATGSSRASAEARHRVACLRGDIPRPWTWNAL